MSEELAQRLYARLTTQDDKNLLIACLQKARDDGRQSEDDPAVSSMRNIFEHAAVFVLIGAASLGVAYVIQWIGQNLLPDTKAGRLWVFWLAFGSFFAAVLVINISFDGKWGAGRKAWAERFARRYGYAITLGVGIFAGWNFYSYTIVNSAAREAEEMVLRTCVHMPSCLARAERYYGGDIVPLLGLPSR